MCIKGLNRVIVEPSDPCRHMELTDVKPLMVIIIFIVIATVFCVLAPYVQSPIFVSSSWQGINGWSNYTVQLEVLDAFYNTDSSG